jgi:AcrR family transcriptional regulator
MTEASERAPSRLDRRKAQTRAVLIGAAQAFLASGRADVTVSEIAKAADVGHGTFYNHFDSKEEILRVAIEEALDAHGAMLDALTGPLEDPAEVFAQSFRLTGRLHRWQPELSKVLLHDGLALSTSEHGLRPRVLRDITAGLRVGRFTVRDPELAVTIIAGAALCLGRLLHDQPERDDAEAADQISEDLLRMLGLPADEAHAISRRPLPDLGELAGPPTTTTQGTR